MIKSMVVGFCFIGGWCYSEWFDNTCVGFDNTCTVSGKWNVPRVIPKLYGWVCKTLRLSPLVVEHSVVIMSARLNPMGSQFSIPLLWNLCSEPVVAKTVETQLRTPTLADRVQLRLGWNTYVLFNNDILNFLWKTDEGEAENIVLLIFVLVELEFSVDEEWWSGAESLI